MNILSTQLSSSIIYAHIEIAHVQFFVLQQFHLSLIILKQPNFALIIRYFYNWSPTY